MEIHYTGIKVSVSTFEIHKSLWLMVFACPSEKKENTETDEKQKKNYSKHIINSFQYEAQEWPNT